MSYQLGTAPASFLRGGIASRHLPSADVPVFTTRRGGIVRASGTQGVDCSVNPHIPACRPQTSACDGGGGPATGSFCPTREFNQTCGCP
jgi:hypothetical protein